MERGSAWGGRIAVGAGLAVAGAVFLFAMQGMNDSGSPAGGAPATSTLTPAATETVQPEPTATESMPTSTTEAVTSPYPEVVIGAPLSLDAEFLVVVYGGVGNEAPPTHIERTLLEDGLIQGRVTVLDAAEFAGADAYLNAWRNVHYPTRGTGEAVLAAICLDAQCGGIGPADPDARTLLVRSTDRGRTWEQLGTLDAAFWIHAWSQDGTEAILFRYPTGEDAFGAPWEYVRWPSMAEVARPTLSAGEVLDRRAPLLLADGSLAWWAAGGLVDEAGAVILDFVDLGVPFDASSVEFFEASLSPDGARLVLTWATETRRGMWHWTLFERGAGGRFEVISTLRQPADGSPAVPYSWLDEDRVVIPAGMPPAALGLPADARIGYVPAVLDFTSGGLAAIAGFEAPDVVSRGNLVISVERR
ncbi:MAG: hypothetical protein M0R73_09615 [Dehalococcoidia bacterium]|nr:hypothetical protein [Dehalococcoidia bacterium]